MIFKMPTETERVSPLDETSPEMTPSQESVSPEVVRSLQEVVISSSTSTFNFVSGCGDNERFWSRFQKCFGSLAAPDSESVSESATLASFSDFLVRFSDAIPLAAFSSAMRSMLGPFLVVFLTLGRRRKWVESPVETLTLGRDPCLSMELYQTKHTTIMLPLINLRRSWKLGSQA